MIGVLSHHWASEDRVMEARNLLDRNGLAQSKWSGFVSRQTLYSLSDPTKITTLVVWDSDETYNAWRASPERAVAMAGSEEMWARPPESEPLPGRWLSAGALDADAIGGSGYTVIQH